MHAINTAYNTPKINAAMYPKKFHVTAKSTRNKSNTTGQSHRDLQTAPGKLKKEAASSAINISQINQCGLILSLCHLKIFSLRILNRFEGYHHDSKQ